MDNAKLKQWTRLWAVFLIAAWSLVVALLTTLKGNLTVEELLRYQPENPWLATLGMLILFCLKSVDFLIHSGVLYAASGILFSFPAAILINAAGIAIVVTPFYWLGRTLGVVARDRLLVKYPKLQTLSQLKIKQNWLRVMLLRLIGPPLLAVNLYMGAEECPYGSYLLGSLLGVLPQVLCFTVMGMKITEPGSPEFAIALVLQIVEMLSALLVYRTILKRRKVSSTSEKFR